MNNQNSNLGAEKIRNFFPIYKRGQLVVVKFGTDEKFEFRGIHFAIICNKKDNSKSSGVTVIPLTSSFKKFHVDLGKFLIDKINPQLDKDLLEIENKSKEIQEKMDEILRKIEELKNDLSNYLDEIGVPKKVPHTLYFKFRKFFSFLNPENVLNLTRRPYGEEYRNLLERIDLSGRMKTYEDDQTIEKLIHMSNKCISTAKEFEILKKEAKSFEENNTQFRQVLDIYETKNKRSYAAVASITTISKERILKPINIYDPIRNLRLSDSLLNKIDEEIKRQYTNFD